MMRIAVLLLTAACAGAQPTIDIHLVSGRASERLKSAERRWQKAGQLHWREAKAAEEIAVLAAVTKLYEEMFQPELPAAPRIATLTEKGNDVLVARWVDPIGQGALLELIAWDTPGDTSLMFRLPRRSWSSEPAIRASFERLLLVPRANGQTPPPKGVTVNVARDPYTHQRVGAGGLLLKYIPMQFDPGPMNWFDLWETDAASYLAVTFNAHAAPGFPPNMRWISERFPPLESRITEWGKKRILDELGPGGFSASRRDYVLARELMRRELTNEELLALLKRREPDMSGVVLRVVVGAHQVARFAGAIREYLQGDRGGNAKANAPFDIVAGSDEANFTAVALEVLRQDDRASAAFRYAAGHGTTVAEYEALAKLRRLQEHEWELSQMRQRLGVTESGDPKPPK